MRLLIKHDSHYEYAEKASLGPHLIRLRPAVHAKARVESYALRIAPVGELRWQQDPAGNRVARATFPVGSEVTILDVGVELAVEIKPVNPFDFFVDDACRTVPFTYEPALRRELQPYMTGSDDAAAGPQLDSFLQTLPRDGDVVSLVVALNEAVNRRVAYVIREETGVYTPEQTLTEGRGSCRDSATLLVAAMRSRGLAARFVSGYLVQLTDEGMIPNAPRGMSRDVVDLHAWAEVFIPGAGWVGLDATSGLLCGEGHIPLACAATSLAAAPLDGTSSCAPMKASFTMSVARLGHEPRPTTPYEDHVWESLLAAGDATDAKLQAQGLALTMGGEPTFNAREDADAPEWNGEALGDAKWEKGLALAAELRRRLAPGAATIVRMGKHYPGEELPRWALELVGRKDGKPIWEEVAAADGPRDHEHAKKLAEALAKRLGVSRGLSVAYEDPWRFLQDEATLPIEVDPLEMDLKSPALRQQLALVLDRGLNTPAGYVLPLARRKGKWVSERWTLRRGHVFLLQGTSPMGLRLPLASLKPGEPVPEPPEAPVEPPDPRIAKKKGEKEDKDPNAPGKPVRTALTIEARDGLLHAFIPPFATAADFLALLAELDATRRETGLDVRLEGYAPPRDDQLFTFAVTPDPGVLEVNLPPARTSREHTALCSTVFDAALATGLHAEKYLLDGRMAGSGGGHHLTLGGPTLLESPFLRRPELLASLLTFIQHHPSMSYA
ncbi:MAG: transglutaminase family protein, partial [Polyangiales bacterium]